MKPPKFPSLITGALLLGATLATPRAAAQTTGFANQVVDYTVGTGISSTYQNAGSALGKPGGSVGTGTLNPFSPNFAGTELTGIGMGGQLTLGLSNFVTVGATGTREIGIFGNVGLINAGSSGQPAAANPATAFGVRSVLISVSSDGANFVPINAAGGLVTSTLPANFYTNADTTNVSAPPPANPTLADFSKPFLGSLTDFDGKTYAQALVTLDGSAGGTWLDLNATGLSQVGYIRFSEPTSGGANGGVFYLNGVSLNGSLIGSVVPEPGSILLVAIGGVIVLAWRGGRRHLQRGSLIIAAFGVALGVFSSAGPASAQILTFADIRNWTGTGANQAAMVVDWHDGKNPESLVWGYRWDGNATGLQMIQAINAADPRLAVFFAYGGSFTYGIGYDLNRQGGTFTPGTPGFDNQGNSTETGMASNPLDHYAEGSFTKFWGYDIGVGNPFNGGSWTPPQDFGADSRMLMNGAWDGWSLSFDEANFTVPDPRFPTAAEAVPEPTAVALTVLGGVALGGLALRSRQSRPA